MRLTWCLYLYNCTRRPKWDIKFKIIFSVVEIRVQIERFKLVVADAVQLSQDADRQLRELGLVVFEVRPHFGDLLNGAFPVTGVVDRDQAEFIFSFNGFVSGFESFGWIVMFLGGRKLVLQEMEKEERRENA